MQPIPQKKVVVVVHTTKLASKLEEHQNKQSCFTVDFSSKTVSGQLDAIDKIINELFMILMQQLQKMVSV
ncbi:hypothetical protein C3Z13_09795 [Avibacterium endocarditidis]|uniref:Uncharacterized protein n=1 Tax=Avibacterium endocarditidis TaxID=380674 RepID=A0ABX4ZQQ7_9PAST|nr:hypothetical protein C3Z13_09795 [Avibacterium endocarditidis]